MVSVRVPSTFCPGVPRVFDTNEMARTVRVTATVGREQKNVNHLRNTTVVGRNETTTTTTISITTTTTTTESSVELDRRPIVVTMNRIYDICDSGHEYFYCEFVRTKYARTGHTCTRGNAALRRNVH